MCWFLERECVRLPLTKSLIGYILLEHFWARVASWMFLTFKTLTHHLTGMMPPTAPLHCEESWAAFVRAEEFTTSMPSLDGCPSDRANLKCTGQATTTIESWTWHLDASASVRLANNNAMDSKDGKSLLISVTVSICTINFNINYGHGW